ncbi:unnamed protein product [Lactuca saligna]|uniref:Myb/SANT-like domain-containing protein n=1 Tax=Lactuca saligna TaxID=75948 RepID=A0AA35VYJ0_LACSI|nr:unnamed protein product [Lactuca saligna]
MRKVIMSKQEASGSEKEQVKWSDKMDCAYTKAMIKQLEIGNRVNGSFTPTAYAQMVEELNKEHQMNITKTNNEIHLENEYVDLDDDIQGVIPTSFSQGQSSGAKKCKSKKRKFEEEEEEEEEEDFNSKIMKSVDNVAGAIREGNIIFDRAYPREYTGGEIYRELELVGLEPHELPRALSFLAAN